MMIIIIVILVKIIYLIYYKVFEAIIQRTNLFDELKI